MDIEWQNQSLRRPARRFNVMGSAAHISGDEVHLRLGWTKPAVADRQGNLIVVSVQPVLAPRPTWRSTTG